MDERGPEPDDEVARHRPMALVVLLAVGAGAILFLVVASLLTIPLFALARFTEPGRGTGREWFRDGLRWAVLAAVVVAATAGTGLAWWFRKGGRIPHPPKPWDVE